MKKIMFLLFLIFGVFYLVSAQTDQRATYASGFDGDKPLKKNKMVEVTEILSNGIQNISDPRKAYKGETSKIFLKRIHKEDSVLVATYISKKVTPIAEDQKVEKALDQTSTKFDYLKALVIIGFVGFLFSMILFRKR